MMSPQPMTENHPTPTFRTIVDSAYNAKTHNRVRWSKTLAFLRPHESAGAGLDIGDRSAFTGTLESFFGCPFDTTSIDLDVDELQGEYDVVTCLDVIEHLFNPLHCLLQIRSVLKPGGTLYLTSPRYKPHLLWSQDHYHEMSTRSMMALLERAGYSVRRSALITTQPWWFYFTGFRPLLRGLFNRTWLFELRANP